MTSPHRTWTCYHCGQVCGDMAGGYGAIIVQDGSLHAEYLRTPEWLARRQVMYKRFGYKCQVCYAAGELHVHHRTYDRRGREHPSDLTVLCSECHGKFHDKLPSPPEREAVAS